MPLRVKGETERALQALPLPLMLRPGGVRPVPGQVPACPVETLYWGGAPLMKLAGALAPSLMTSNLALGMAMIALAGRENPPATIECADINRIAQACAMRPPDQRGAASSAVPLPAQGHCG